MDVKNAQSGLTLIEVIVVIAIFAVVASVLFFNFSNFNTNVSVRNLAQEVSLAIRKAQVYATGVHSIDGVQVSSELYPAYGISFSANTSTTPMAPNQRQFVLFVDAANYTGTTNRSYDNSGSCGNPSIGNECVEAFGITSGDRIVSLCTDGGCSSTNTVNVVFRRPSPDAEICIDTGGSCSTRLSFLKIVIESVRGVQRTVQIWNTGQISVQ